MFIPPSVNVILQETWWQMYSLLEGITIFTGCWHCKIICFLKSRLCKYPCLLQIWMISEVYIEIITFAFSILEGYWKKKESCIVFVYPFCSASQLRFKFFFTVSHKVLSFLLLLKAGMSVYLFAFIPLVPESNLCTILFNLNYLNILAYICAFKELAT